MNKSQKIKTMTAMLLCLALAACCVLLMGKVGINYSISDYLGDDTDTKKALQIMKDDFGMTTDIKVMIEAVDEAEAAAVAAQLQAVPNVLMVSFDAGDPHHYIDQKALFSLMVDGDEYSQTAADAIDDVKAIMADYDDHAVTYGGTAVQNQSLRQTITVEIPYILAISIGLVVLVLLLVSDSWLEPFVLLASAGVAVVINLGTNVIFGEISYITNSVAAILQLALSIDYSIMLLHAYRAERETADNSMEAIKRTTKAVLRPVSASAMTTLAGLLALLFMSFGIGFDIGMVLMKGIVVSAVISLTLFPLLILWTEKLMQKTTKKALHLRGRRFAKLATKSGRVVLPVFLVLLIVSGVISNRTAFTFAATGDADTTIEDTFGSSNQVLLVYENLDQSDDAERAFIQRIGALRDEQDQPILLSYTAHFNTVGETYDAQTLASMLSVSEQDAAMLVALCGLYEDPDSVTMTAKEFMQVAADLLENDPDVAALISEEDKAAVVSLLQTEHPMLTVDTAYTFRELALGAKLLFSSAPAVNEEMIAGVYMKHAIRTGAAAATASAVSLVDFAVEQVDNPLLASRLTDEHKAALGEAHTMLSEAAAMFRSDRHSRMVLSLDLDVEGEQTTVFMQEASAAADEIFGERAYLAGLIPSTYDLCQTFTYDNVLISVFTIVSIFVIVMLIFRSLSLPVILVAVIQGAIWFMMSILNLVGQDIFFMGYIMASCILMGATIDYGILMSNSYVELRRTKGKAQALKGAVETAMPTVFTSGGILAICGIVIYFISSQSAIAVVGLLVGVGAMTSTVFITVVLPSLLWLLDTVILKLTMKKR